MQSYVDNSPLYDRNMICKIQPVRLWDLEEYRITQVFGFFFRFINIVCMYASMTRKGRNMPRYTCGHQRVTLHSCFSPSTFMWAPGIELVALSTSHLPTPYKEFPSRFQLCHCVSTISPALLAAGVDGLIGSWRYSSSDFISQKMNATVYMLT